MSFAVIRMKYGDIVPHTGSRDGDPMFCKISIELERAIESGKIAIEDAISMYQRGGDPETLLKQKQDKVENADPLPDNPADMTFTQLRTYAKSLGIEFRSTTKKEELLILVNEFGKDDAPAAETLSLE